MWYYKALYEAAWYLALLHITDWKVSLFVLICHTGSNYMRSSDGKR